MSGTKLSVGALNGALRMIAGTLADLSDADFLTRPCTGANHVTWQLGHLVGATTNMINGTTPGAMPELPAGFVEKFKKDTAGKDDAAFFPTRAQIVEQFDKTMQAAIKWMTSLNDADLTRPAPEKMRSMAPTVGDVAALLPMHIAMHLGQFQVLRRKLGKPILF